MIQVQIPCIFGVLPGLLNIIPYGNRIVHSQVGIIKESGSSSSALSICFRASSCRCRAFINRCAHNTHAQWNNSDLIPMPFYMLVLSFSQSQFNCINITQYRESFGKIPVQLQCLLCQLLSLIKSFLAIHPTMSGHILNKRLPIQHRLIHIRDLLRLLFQNTQYS